MSHGCHTDKSLVRPPLGFSISHFHTTQSRHLRFSYAGLAVRREDKERQTRSDICKLGGRTRRKEARSLNIRAKEKRKILKKRVKQHFLIAARITISKVQAETTYLLSELIQLTSSTANTCIV